MLYFETHIAYDHGSWKILCCILKLALHTTMDHVEQSIEISWRPITTVNFQLTCPHYCEFYFHSITNFITWSISILFWQVDTSYLPLYEATAVNQTLVSDRGCFEAGTAASLHFVILLKAIYKYLLLFQSSLCYCSNNFVFKFTGFSVKVLVQLLKCSNLIGCVRDRFSMNVGIAWLARLERVWMMKFWKPKWNATEDWLCDWICASGNKVRTLNFLAILFTLCVHVCLGERKKLYLLVTKHTLLTISTSHFVSKLYSKTKFQGKFINMQFIIYVYTRSNDQLRTCKQSKL
jgi:hypothetical protein